MIDTVMFKKYVQRKLESYIIRYFKKHPEVKLVVVAGSVGKTSTKVAIATVLSQKYRVQLYEGNHNTHLSAPLAMLGIEYPENIKSLGAWLSVFRAARKRIADPTGVDVIVQELGVDKPGDMAQFARYLQADIGVVTSVAPEHMAYFETMDAVAREELSVAGFSKLVIINRDDIDGQYASYLTNPSLATYGTSGLAEYRFEGRDFSLADGHAGSFIAPEFFDERVEATIRVVGEHNVRPAVAAATVGVKLGLTPKEIMAGLSAIRPVNGRMNVLRGAENTTIIDDTYNSSPSAAASALQTLYQLPSPQRIAVLGSMNELGTSSASEHEVIGKLCDPSLLSWVVTVGKEAEDHLAPAARANGCQVKSFLSAIQAGAFVRSVMEPGAIILAKGSQNSIFVEEAVKVLLHSTSDEAQLVRQSAQWNEAKRSFFSQFS